MKDNKIGNENKMISKKTIPKKVILIIRDGWGYRENPENNAIKEAETPNDDRYMQEYPNSLIDASGTAVGLPEGFQGNSEVGHITIGSGRIILQPLERINKSISDESFYENGKFIEAIQRCKKKGTSLHLIGLLQVEGVHSHMDHLFALLELCKRERFHDVKIHAITDGRDAPVTRGIEKMEMLNDRLRNLGFGKIMTVSGRYYAMDRDNRWDRTKTAFDCIVKARCNLRFEDPVSALRKKYSDGETDEFISPLADLGYSGMKDGDSVIFFNFRTDRTRQLTKAIVEKEFDGWEREAEADSKGNILKEKCPDVFFVAMTQYYKPMDAEVAFGDIKINNLLGETISKEGKTQLRISETEKYAHVTFFFNGQREEPYEGENRIMIQSPKVKTYDLKPEMSVYEIAENLETEIEKKEYDFILTNLVNCDMVGHTGDVDAIRKAVHAVDEGMGRIVEKGLENDYVVLVCADHGNAEDQSEEWRTSHTINKVPFMMISDDEKFKSIKLRKDGGLKDIAPTILGILGIEIPEGMEGQSLIRF